MISIINMTTFSLPAEVESVDSGAELKKFLAVQDACLRIVDVRGIMACACAKQRLAHVQSNGVHMAMVHVNGAWARQSFWRQR